MPPKELRTPFPTGRWLWAATVGALVFLVSWGIGIGGTLLIIRAVPADVPNPTEPREGLGDAMTAMFLFCLGVVLSFFPAAVVGYAAAVLVVHRRVTRGQS
ncbi:unnamed protein product [Gemmata massiliana]|uniref:Uncharacterized protein n=1 Tax=Gemmata massiliana TaxID=1210884 RepID=A0A6P2DBW7_9BACT|nr:unnamed protein product [Gemmata massiliana]